MIAIDSVQRTIILVKRFGLYIFVPLFLLLAYSYVSSTHQQYRATAKIALKNISAEEVAHDLHSEPLVKQALDQLNFQASYYDAESPREELYGSEVAVRLKFDGPRKTGADEAWLNLDVAGKDSYTLTNQDTTAYYSFNAPVNASFGSFMVTRRPGNKLTEASYLVHLDDPNKQLDTWSENLNIEPDDNGRSATISIVAGNPRKGAAFLNKLLQLYAGETPDRHGDLDTDKFNLVEKPEQNFESASLSPLWFYFLALVAGLAIPLGVPELKKKRKANVRWLPISLPKLLNQVQHRLAIKQVD